jgi:uracil-DNA glycosylase family 4
MPNILTKIEHYFKQQQALAGDTLYTAPMLRERIAEIERTSLLETTILQELSPVLTEMPTPKSRIEPSTQPAAAPIVVPIIESMFGEESLPKKTNTKSSVPETWKDASTLDALRNDIHTCLNCKLGATRTNFVFGIGNPTADILVIGEAPGADEDATGEPFVGRAGQLLTKILEAINLRREDVYIANIIKCRPPGNRRPETDEVLECEPYLYKQIDLIQPKFILALGLTAVDTLLKTKHTMSAIRGKEIMFRGIPMIATYHPAALMRNPEWKRAAWEDVQYLRRLYDAYLAQQNGETA